MYRRPRNWFTIYRLYVPPPRRADVVKEVGNVLTRFLLSKLFKFELSHYIVRYIAGIYPGRPSLRLL